MTARVGRAARGAARLLLVTCLGSFGCASDRAGPGARAQGSTEIDLTGSRLPTPGDEASPTEIRAVDASAVAVRMDPRAVPAPAPYNPIKGPADAKVTVQLWSDFQCSFCIAAAPELDELERRYRGKIRLVYRHYPLPFHALARPAARASVEAFQERGPAGFWALHDWLYGARGDAREAPLLGAATSLGLDAARVREAMHDTRYDAFIDADIAAGDAAGIEGTPAALINDLYVMGARSVEEYAAVVELALREAAPR